MGHHHQIPRRRHPSESIGVVPSLTDIRPPKNLNTIHKKAKIIIRLKTDNWAHFIFSNGFHRYTDGVVAMNHGKNKTTTTTTLMMFHLDCHLSHLSSTFVLIGD